MTVSANVTFAVSKSEFRKRDMMRISGLLYMMIMIVSLLLSGCHHLVQEGASTELAMDTPKEVLQSNDCDYKDSIIKEIEDGDLDGDGVTDKVILYLENNKVMLMAKDTSIELMSLENEAQVLGDDINDQYLFDLCLRGNKILIGWTYSYINKYESSAWLECYSFESNDLRRVWSSDEVFNKKAAVIHYDQDHQTVEVSVDGVSREILIDEKEASEFLSFIDFYKTNDIELPEIEFRLMPQYAFYDVDGDHTKEIITRTVITCGASPIKDRYISVFSYTSEGIVEIDGWFESSRQGEGR